MVDIGNSYFPMLSFTNMECSILNINNTIQRVLIF